MVDDEKSTDDRLAVVVIDPPANFESVVCELGYVVGKLADLEGLSIEAMNVVLPKGRSIDAAFTELDKHFPGLVIGEREIADRRKRQTDFTGEGRRTNEDRRSWVGRRQVAGWRAKTLT